MGDIIVISVLVLVIALVIVSQLRKKKTGKACAGCNGCGAHCTACPSKDKGPLV